MATIKNDFIHVVGADANNLRDINVSFPVGGISLIAGVSGSGKSSLLKNVLATEGNFRLKEFLGINQKHLDRPKSQSFVGKLPATIHVGQQSFRASSRTTVGTASGFLSLLRQMFIRWSRPYSDITNKIVNPPDVYSYSEWLYQHHKGNIKVWAIPINFTNDDGVIVAKRLKDLGIESVIVRSETDSPQQWEKGRCLATTGFKPLSRKSRHLVEVKIGQVKITKDSKQSFKELLKLLKLAFDVGEDKVFIELLGNKNPDLQTSSGSALDSRHHWVIPSDERIYRKPDTHLLSFNAPDHDASGACSVCRGLGRTSIVDIDSLIASPVKSMSEGAFALWTLKNYKYLNIQHSTIEGLRGVCDFNPDIPWNKLSDEAKSLILYGSGSILVTDIDPDTLKKTSQPRIFPGFITSIMKHINKGNKTSERLAFLIKDDNCPNCQGTRWSHAASSLKLSDKSIHELLSFNFDQFLAQCSKKSDFAKALPDDAMPYLARLLKLSESFVDVGLAHLTADRCMLQISEGESRRIRLASAFDGQHEGLCLLLDEPARGLHDQDVTRLTSTLGKLRGPHTLIINEHRQRLAHVADHFIQIGPGAGINGGQVIYEGKVPEDWWETDARMVRTPLPIRKNQEWLKVYGAKCNNLQNIDVELPLGKLICVTGVSGSGKSSFVHGVLKPALNDLSVTSTSLWRKISGTNQIGKLVSLDQHSPQANRRSTVATFLDIAKLLRNHYGKLPSAIDLGLKASDFGFNSGNGRCFNCLGIGETKDGEQWVPCASCGGLRFENIILSIKDKGLNIVQLLDLSISQLVNKEIHVLKTFSGLLSSINALGLGHLSLGRRLDTLSGGEIQRLRIARQLNISRSKGLVFILDEPASGLHKTDVANLLKAIDHILAEGENTVVLVEHNLDIVSLSDWVIEFGPKSGPKGGKVVAYGPPSKISKTDTATGRMLRTLGKQPDLNIPPPLKPHMIQLPTDSVTAANTLRWLRRLLGDDIPPKANTHTLAKIYPTITFNIDHHRHTRVMEYGGLDREFISLVLEQQTLSDAHYDLSSFVEIWERQSSATLVIHPLLHDMYVWGKNIPKSIVKNRQAQLVKQGYQWIDHDDITQVRVKSDYFSCQDNASLSVRKEIVLAAIAIGSGYVELRKDSKTITYYTTRLINMQKGLIAPMAVSPYDLLRTGQRGHCKACSGSGSIATYDQQHIFGDTALSVEDKNFLDPQALSVLKGVHRNILLPFFKRMIKEGLWNSNTPIANLSKEQLDILLYGYWSRPSLGSFLKTPKANPNEVSSWLRWDGLIPHLRDNAVRGDNEWQSILSKTSVLQSCPFCDGTGLQPFIELLNFAEYNYRHWMEKATINDLYHALNKMNPVNSRISSRRKRLLSIFKRTVDKGDGNIQISDLLHNSSYETLIPDITSNFTFMPLLIEEV